MKLGAYTLIKKIAEGGIAEIYLAKARTVSKSDKYLICKCIKKNLSEDTDFLKSILNEVHCTVRLRHPNIVEVFDLLACEGHSFLTMEYLDAQDFHKLLKYNADHGERMPYDIAVYVIGQAALGLHAAHELTDLRGRPLHLVHRDISPENILFGSGGEVKLADFGIAKTANMTDQTPPDIIKGKFNYMSPEHAWGDKLDRRSDLFGLAVIMYEALLNRSFYPVDSVEATMQCARTGLFEPPRQIDPEFPQDLERILLKALDLDKKQRYPTVFEFKLALDQCAAAHGWAATRESWLAYLQTRVAFPSQRLPLMHAGEMAPDSHSILKPEVAENTSHEADLDATGQLSEEHMAALASLPAAQHSGLRLIPKIFPETEGQSMPTMDQMLDLTPPGASPMPTMDQMLDLTPPGASPMPTMDQMLEATPPGASPMPTMDQMLEVTPPGPSPIPRISQQCLSPVPQTKPHETLLEQTSDAVSVQQGSDDNALTEQSKNKRLMVIMGVLIGIIVISLLATWFLGK